MAREKIFLRVIKGALVPADDSARDKLRARGFHAGDVLQADLRRADLTGAIYADAILAEIRTTKQEDK